MSYFRHHYDTVDQRSYAKFLIDIVVALDNAGVDIVRLNHIQDLLEVVAHGYLDLEPIQDLDLIVEWIIKEYQPPMKEDQNG